MEYRGSPQKLPLHKQGQGQGQKQGLRRGQRRQQRGTSQQRWRAVWGGGALLRWCPPSARQGTPVARQRAQGTAAPAAAAAAAERTPWLQGAATGPGQGQGQGLGLGRGAGAGAGARRGSAGGKKEGKRARAQNGLTHSSPCAVPHLQNPSPPDARLPAPPLGPGAAAGQGQGQGPLGAGVGAYGAKTGTGAYGAKTGTGACGANTGTGAYGERESLGGARSFWVEGDPSIPPEHKVAAMELFIEHERKLWAFLKMRPETRRLWLRRNVGGD